MNEIISDKIKEMTKEDLDKYIKKITIKMVS